MGAQNVGVWHDLATLMGDQHYIGDKRIMQISVFSDSLVFKAKSLEEWSNIHLHQRASNPVALKQGTVSNSQDQLSNQDNFY